MGNLGNFIEYDHASVLPYYFVANLEQRLDTIQEEHLEELKVLQMEGRMLCQQLKESREEEEKARNQVKKLSAALEMATTTKVYFFFLLLL